MSIVLTVFLLAGVAVSRGGESSPGPERGFEKGLFTSSEYPAISIRFDEALRYIGAARTELDGGAIVDRHHLVDATPDGRIKSLFVLHFETQPPGPDRKYRYKIPKGEDAAGRDYRFTPEPVRLGEHDYIQNTWVFDAKTSVEENPTKELAATAALLAREGLSLPDELHMSRFVRVVDEEAKREFILFYLEPLDPQGPHVPDFLEGRVAQDVFDALSEGITARSRKEFQVVAG